MHCSAPKIWRPICALNVSPTPTNSITRDVHFVLECRAAGIEPIDAPYTFSDTDGAVREARYARRLGYRSKALVRPEHAQPINAVLTPDDDEVRRASGIVDGFEASRARGEDRALVEGLWVEGTDV